MKKRKCVVPFSGNKEQEKELLSAITQMKNEKGSLIPIMQKAQDIYGYLPLEVQRMIAGELGISTAEVYGVATFYSQFALTPKGEYKISVCMGTACYVKGSQKILDRISKKLGIGPDECTPDGKFSIDACRCIGACGLAPVITINDDVYGCLEEKDVDGIIEKYL